MKNNEISLRYWDYFCALESDFKKISRYIEFTDDNLNTYSIELTKIFLSVCSEIDVLLKDICYELNNSSKPSNINQYQLIIKAKLPELILEEVNINFSFLNVKPWESWTKGKTPKWWTNHNKVKHERSKYYNEANLDNVVNAIGALFICVNYYYKIIFSNRLPEEKKEKVITFKEVTNLLKSDVNFIRFSSSDYYIDYLRVN